MTKQELAKLIEDNFTDKNGVIDLKGLTFSKDVDISEMKVEGSLYQDKQEVEGHLYQNKQEVEGHLYQNYQKVGMDLIQSGQKVKGRTYN